MSTQSPPPQDPNYGQQQQQQPPPPPPTKQRKKRRIFLWFFLIVQLIFLIWIISAVSSSGGDATDCGSLTQQECNDASDVGTGIGVFLLILIWFFVDCFLAVIYGVYRLASRRG